MEKWKQGVTEWLLARDDADALLTAAILLVNDEVDDMEKKLGPLLKRATAKAPDSARIHVAAIRLCLQTQYCDAAPYLRELRRIAPDNALGWVVDTARARKADGQEALRSALTEMSRARTYDIYENAGVAAFNTQLREARVPLPRVDGSGPAFSTDKFANDVFYKALQFHHYAIQKFCRTATDDKILADCHQVGVAMRAGDSVTINLVGISFSGHGLSAGSAEARSLAQQERQIRWAQARLAEIRKIEGRSGITVQSPHDLEILAKYPREIDAWRAVLEEHGIPTEPPTEWKCDECRGGMPD